MALNRVPCHWFCLKLIDMYMFYFGVRTGISASKFWNYYSEGGMTFHHVHHIHFFVIAVGDYIWRPSSPLWEPYESHFSTNIIFFISIYILCFSFQHTYHIFHFSTYIVFFMSAQTPSPTFPKPCISVTNRSNRCFTFLKDINMYINYAYNKNMSFSYSRNFLP